MKTFTRRFIPFAAVAAASLSGFGAQAFQGEQNPLPPQPFQPARSRAAVQQEALRPPPISNGGTGVAMPTGMADRAAVRMQARAISARGAATYGEIQR